MLLPEQVIPFLSSDDPLLRDQATRYFSDYARSPFPLTAEQCWAAINQIGLRSEAYALIGLLPLASQNDAATGQLLAALDAPSDDLTRSALFDALAEIDFEQLRHHRETIFARSDIPDEIRARLQNRLDLAELSVDALWQQLEQHALDHKDRYWNETDHSIEATLIEALARHGQPAIERAMALIDNPAATAGILEICAIDLLAGVRYRPAMETLVKKFIAADEDDDVLYETMERALPRIAGLDLIPAIEAIFFEQTEQFQLYVADAIAGLRHPDAEAALLRLYDDEKNEQSHVNIALALLNLCPTDGLPILVELFRAGFGDKYLKGDFEQALVACSLMAGFEFEELPLLREVLVNRAAVDRLRREGAALKGIPLDQLDDDLYEKDFQDQYDDESFIDPLPPPSGTIRNEHPKIGRNDPCPCGSGKKYKKCCLDKERA